MNVEQASSPEIYMYEHVANIIIQPAPATPSATPGLASDMKVDAKATKPAKPPNPVWRMMGLPDMHLRLPSRNWMIFFTVAGSLSAAIIYDKREKNRAQRKWCRLVQHLAEESLEPKAMPRKLTVFLESPPGDGLRIAQDHFKEYVKPILVASGLDWDFVQGRKEGDVRAELAEKIRKLRRPYDPETEEDPALRLRRQNGIVEYPGPQGDIVIGRHTWKEYLRGLHEGWLGPLTAPNFPPASQSTNSTTVDNQDSSLTDDLSAPPENKPTEASESAPDSPEEPPKPSQIPAFISTAAYPSAPTPADLPEVLDPSEPIPFPHILGFFNTGIRLVRFLNRRHLADDIGRDVAAIVLANSRPYHSTVSDAAFSEPTSFVSDSPTAVDIMDVQPPSEQSVALAEEEKDWHKSIKKPVENATERPWLDVMVLDPRIASRMRKAELRPEDEERVRTIVVPEEEVEGKIKGTLRGLWKDGKTYLGIGVKKTLTPAEQGFVEDNTD